VNRSGCFQGRLSDLKIRGSCPLHGAHGSPEARSQLLKWKCRGNGSNMFKATPAWAEIHQQLAPKHLGYLPAPVGRWFIPLTVLHSYQYCQYLPTGAGFLSFTVACTIPP